MAVNDPAEYIDPIIKSMIATRQAQQEGANLAERTRASKEEEAARRHALDLQEAQSKRTLDLQQQAHDLAKQHYDLLAQSEHLKRLIDAGEAAQKGILKPNGGMQPGQIPTVLNQGKPTSFNIPGIGSIDSSMFDNPDAANARTLALRAAEAEANRKAQFGMLQDVNQLPPSPTEVAKLGSAEKIANIGAGSRENVANTNVAGREDVSEQTNATRAFTAMLMAQARQDAANKGIPPEAINSLHDQMAAGDIANNPTNKTHQLITPILDKEGFKYGKPWVDDVAQLKTLQDLGPILDRFQSFTDLLSKSKPGALVTGMVAGSPISTEIKTKEKEIRSDLFNVAKRLEGIKGSRQVMGIIKLEEGAMPTSGDLQKYGQDKVDQLRQRWQQATNFLLKGVPQEQIDILKSKGITFPEAGNQPQQKQNYQHIRANTAGHQIGSNNGVDWFDIQTGAKIQ